MERECGAVFFRYAWVHVRVRSLSVLAPQTESVTTPRIIFVLPYARASSGAQTRDLTNIIFSDYASRSSRRISPVDTDVASGRQLRSVQARALTTQRMRTIKIASTATTLHSKAHPSEWRL